MITVLVIGGGIGLLIGLAVLIGEEQAPEEAWIRIARERRRLAEIKREMVDIAVEGGLERVRRLERLDP